MISTISIAATEPVASSVMAIGHSTCQEAVVYTEEKPETVNLLRRRRAGLWLQPPVLVLGAGYGGLCDAAMTSIGAKAVEHWTYDQAGQGVVV